MVISQWASNKTHQIHPRWYELSSCRGHPAGGGHALNDYIAIERMIGGIVKDSNHHSIYILMDLMVLMVGFHQIFDVQSHRNLSRSEVSMFSSIPGLSDSEIAIR